MRRGVSRPELFFIYGIIVSAIIVFLFFAKINQLSEMEDIVAEYYANELTLVIDAAAARSGYARVPFAIEHLDEPQVSIAEGFVNVTYLVEDDGVRMRFGEVDRILARVDDPKELVSFRSGLIIASDHAVTIEERIACPEATPTDPAPDVDSLMVTIIVNDPCLGLAEYEALAAVDTPDDRNVQRVVIEGQIPGDDDNDGVVILAR